MTERMTLKAARAAIRAAGARIRATAWGEYRVSLEGGTEAQAYYTNDLQDAVDTALAMRKSWPVAVSLPGMKPRELRRLARIVEKLAAVQDELLALAQVDAETKFAYRQYDRIEKAFRDLQGRLEAEKSARGLGYYDPIPR